MKCHIIVGNVYKGIFWSNQRMVQTLGQATHNSTVHTNNVSFNVADLKDWVTISVIDLPPFALATFWIDENQQLFWPFHDFRINKDQCKHRISHEVDTLNIFPT